jgi:hypothetical protein
MILLRGLLGSFAGENGCETAAAYTPRISLSHGGVLKRRRRDVRSWDGDFPRFAGPWLGQPMPGAEPIEFAPEILCTDRMSFGTVFGPSGDEFLFGHQRPGTDDVHDILSTRLEDGVWTEPERLPFNSDVMDGDHCLSADGRRIYWRSWRLLPDETEPREWSYLWWAERSDEGWSEARLLACGGEIQRTGYPAIGRSDTLYFPARGRDGKASVFRSRRVDGEYGAPEEILSGMKVGGDMCVAPDESRLVIACEGEPENLGKGDLFVSLRRSDDTWTPLRHAGDVVNAPGEDAYTHCPAISPDGRFLFYRAYDFGTERSRVFWVDARVAADPADG